MRPMADLTMVVARVPWDRGGHAGTLQPILVHDGPTGMFIVGYVLPFDDVIPLLTHDESDRAFTLSGWFVENYGSALMSPR